ncbi:MAG: CNNM domain-containing protein, partial [Acidimicrobiales bacterium]
MVFAAWTGADAVMVVVIVVLLVISVFLALAETGLTRMSRTKAQALADEGRPGSRSLLWLVAHPERFLNPVLLVVLVCQLVQASLTGIVANSLFGGWGVAIATFINVVIVFVLAEAAPKTWAIQHPESAALFAARPVAMLAHLWPIRLASRGLIGLANIILPGKGLKEGPFVSEEELLAFADVAVEEAVIEEEQRDLILQIIEF